MESRPPHISNSTAKLGTAKLGTAKLGTANEGAVSAIAFDELSSNSRDDLSLFEQVFALAFLSSLILTTLSLSTVYSSSMLALNIAVFGLIVVTMISLVAVVATWTNCCETFCHFFMTCRKDLFKGRRRLGS